MNEDKNVYKEFFEEIEDITFANVDNLYDRREEISNYFMQKPFQVKQIYKWYFFFQLCLLKEPLKSLLWDYVNGIREPQSIISLHLEYNKLCDRRKQLKKEESEDQFDIR